MSDTLIKVDKLSKKFCGSLKHSLWYGLQDIASECTGAGTRGKGELRQSEFWAVKNISFELRRGECLGLIGRNGAGKTTLLRLLNGLLKPDTGRIDLFGQVGAIIALGATLKPILSGRENIYVSAAVRGLSKRETDRKIDEIIDFTELGDFIDSPVQNYSSGMSVRLNFAVASALEPDVLLLDEVLAVGDASFRNKCYHRIASLRKSTAVIFVSHNMEQVARISSQVLVMDAGASVFIGSVDNGISKYNTLNNQARGSDNTDSFLALHPPVTAFHATLSTDELCSGQALDIHFLLMSTKSLPVYLFKVHFYNETGAFAADGVLQVKDIDLELNEGETQFTVTVDSIQLKNGVYKLAFNFIDQFGDMVVWSYKKHEITVYGAYNGAIADYQLKLKHLANQVCDCKDP
ncbi:MAG: ABC transporter ATP-binding protein [Methylococcales bacterium]